jgi:hypothetical protein
MLARDPVRDDIFAPELRPAGGRGTGRCPGPPEKPPRAGAALICGERDGLMLVGGRGTLRANCGLAPRPISALPVAGCTAKGLLLGAPRMGDPFPRLKLAGGVMCETTGRIADRAGGAAAGCPACAPRIAFRVGVAPTRPMGALAKSRSETRTALPRTAKPFWRVRVGAVVMPPGARKLA